MHFFCFLNVLASGWSWMTCRSPVAHEGASHCAAAEQPLMLSAWVERATWGTGQRVNHHTGCINETAGRMKWNTLNKGEIPVLFVHWSPTNQNLPGRRLPSRCRGNLLPFSGRAWPASGGAGWCSLGSPSQKWMACPLQVTELGRVTAAGDLPLATHAVASRTEEDQSLEWGGRKIYSLEERKLSFITRTSPRWTFWSTRCFRLVLL